MRKGGSSTRGFRRDARSFANLLLILPIASCVPALAGSGPAAELQVVDAPVVASAAAAPQAGAATGVLPAFEGTATGSLEGMTAFAANANLPGRRPARARPPRPSPSARPRRSTRCARSIA